MFIFFDKDGTPLETLEWARKFESYDYRVVGDEHVGPYRVCTFWQRTLPTEMTLAWHHGVHEMPPPVFEAAVLLDREPVVHRYYCTEESALAGHKDLVELMTVVREAADDVQDHP